MKKYIFLSILSFLPLQGFCDRFWVSNSQNINDNIQTIEKEGGVVKDVRANEINGNTVSYTIVYKSGEDIRKMNAILNSLGK